MCLLRFKYTKLSLLVYNYKIASFTKSTSMKALKIYIILLTLAVITLSYYPYRSNKELKEIEEVLQQCSDRYYEVVGK